MRNVRSFAKYWLPALVWMTVIFTASGDRQSFHRSSRIIAPIVRWLVPQISDAALDVTMTLVRKGAHLTEYAILALLFWRALRKPVRHDSRPWSWREAGWAALFVAMYAASDEWHQAFVPSREASLRDVLIDTLGGILGLLLLRAAVRWRRRRLPAPAPAARPWEVSEK